MSATHGANASGRKCELKGSTGASPLGSGFGSGHSSPLVGDLWARMRARISRESTISAIVFVPRIDQDNDFVRRPCTRDVRLQPLQPPANFMKLSFSEIA